MLVNQDIILIYDFNCIEVSATHVRTKIFLIKERLWISGYAR